MAVLGPGRCPIGFPEAVRSILTNSQPKPAREDPIQPLFYIFGTNFQLLTLAFPAFGIYFTSPRAFLGHKPAPPVLWGGEGFALPPQTPTLLKFLRGFAPQTPQKLKFHLLCDPDVVPAGALLEAGNLTLRIFKSCVPDIVPAGAFLENLKK